MEHLGFGEVQKMSLENLMFLGVCFETKNEATNKATKNKLESFR